MLEQGLEIVVDILSVAYFGNNHEQLSILDLVDDAVMAGPDAIDFLLGVQAFTGRGAWLLLEGFDSLDKLSLDFLTLGLDKLLGLRFELYGKHPLPRLRIQVSS